MTLQRNATQFEVLLDGQPVDASVISISHSVGGHEPDSAIIELEQSGYRFVTEKLDRIRLAELVEPSVVRIYATTVDEGRQLRTIGRISGFRASRGNGERILANVRLDHHMMGDPLTLIPVLTRTPGDDDRITEVSTHAPCVFNPRWDGQIQLNRADPEEPRQYPSFLDPEAYPFDIGKFFSLRAYWTMVDAAEFLLNYLGKSEYIQWPSREELNSVLGGNRWPFNNHTITEGALLPQALDELLYPYGYNWYLDYSVGDKPKIRIYDRHNAPRVTVPGPSPYEVPSIDTPGPAAFDLSVNHVRRSANMVILRGDYEVREGTFELVPAWDPEYDEITNPDELAIGSTKWREEPASQRAWRDWVLNEGGDYTGLRPSIENSFDITEFFRGEIHSVKRRKFLPCITLNETRNPYGDWRGVWIEWWNGREWNPIGNSVNETENSGGYTFEGAASVQLLENECGIRFAGQKPPMQLMAMGLDVIKFRITASIRSDFRAEHVSEFRPEYVPDLNPVVINNPNKFQYRTISDTSIFAFDTANGLLQHSEAYPSEDMKEYARFLLQQWNRSTISGPVTMNTAHHYSLSNYLGKQVDGLLSNLLDLQCRRSDPPVFPICTKVEVNIENQTTTLQLDSEVNRAKKAL